MDPTQTNAGNEVCIYRVPRCLREGGREQDAYIPQFVSIGPYHHNREHLRDVERHKQRILDQMLSRKKQNKQTYLDAITALEPRARRCYDTTIDFRSPKFVKMMLLDGCFVIEFLRGFTSNGYSPSYPIFESMKYYIIQDLIVLENQIPLFILNRIWELQQNQGEELMVHFQSFIKEVGKLSNEKQYQQLQLQLQRNYREALHCLDLFRRCFLEEKTGFHVAAVGLDVSSTHLSIPSVTKLKEVGMKFEKRQDLFWEIGYENGVLKLPLLRINHRTKYLFVNLIAFEQCYLREKGHITSYLIFMDNLIDTSEDVRQLTKCKIIENWFCTHDEVATFINIMCQGVMPSSYNNDLQYKCNAINEYYRKHWNTWCAKLKRKYFDSPWSIISLIAGSLLIILTAYTIRAYYQSKN